jgi:hypothetical protein
MNIILLSHLGFGDNILNIPIINYLLEKCETIDIVCYYHNLTNLKYIFDDNKKIGFIPFNTYVEVNNVFGNKNMTYYNNKLILRTGLHAKVSNISSFPFFMFDDLNINRNVIKTHFYIKNTDISIKLYNMVSDTDYIFICNETSNGDLFNIDEILLKNNIDKNNKLVICSNKNIYEKEHKYFNIANEFVYKSNNILLIDYKLVLENASFIILSDSALFIFTILLNLKSKKNIMISRSSSAFVDWNKFLLFMNEKFILY